ncbi:MAG TPA: GIY-YIG nuclease family protein [Pyrinomonadaceae bacterium]|nr:GIY-YIG nuclease family protein [Pyrinomonadaceae bacterium]
MRTRTADGHTLQLPDARLGALLPQLHNSGLDGLIMRNYDGDLSRAVARSVGQLANRARRVGALRGPQTGGRYPVFSSALGGRQFQIVTRQGGAGAGTIVGIRPQSSHSAEYMAAPGQPTLGARRALTTAAADATLNAPGIYQIYRGGRLIYVGQSQNIRQRLQQHLLCLTHMAVPIGGYQAAAGVMAGSTRQTRRTEEVRRRDLNRARPGNRLTNERELEMMIGESSVDGEAMAAARRVQRKRGTGGRPRNSVAPPRGVVGGSCDQVRAQCMATSRARPGSVWGESRCASCADACRSQGGNWPRHMGRKRCDFWA